MLFRRRAVRRDTTTSIHQPAAMPARLALWLGVTAVAAGYIRHIVPLMVIGVIVMTVGIGIWWMFRASRQVRVFREQRAERRLNKRLGLAAPSKKLIGTRASEGDQARRPTEAARLRGGNPGPQEQSDQP